MIYIGGIKAWQIAVIGAVSVLIAIIAFALGSVITGVIFLLFGLVDLGFAYHRYYNYERHGNVNQSTTAVGSPQF